jgi:RNA polymerase sigma factor (sigma-70 family)
LQFPSPPDRAALATQTDESLVRLIQECGHCHPATQVLLLRYRAWVVHNITLQARRARLARHEVADACQEGILATVEAVNAFDLRQEGRDRPCSFRGFLWIVLRARFADFLRARRRAQRHLDLAVQVDEAVARAEGRSDIRRLSGRWCAVVENGPVHAAELGELLARLEQELDQWSCQARQLWEGVSAGRSLRDLAAALDVPYHTLKRQWRQLRLRLIQILPAWRP